MEHRDANQLVGCCGLFCGLCNKYQLSTPSRGIGCRLGEQHAWCSIWNCCVKRRQFETCAECPELFDCPIFLRRKVITWTPAAENLRQIKAVGVANWLPEQIARQTLLVELLRNFNEGRSMSFYCKVGARLSRDLIQNAIATAEEQIAAEKVGASDVKSKARILKTILKDLATKVNQNLD